MKMTRDVLVTQCEIEKIFCNCCGKEINKNPLGYFEDHLSIEKKWGYGSGFDGEDHNIDICKKCYVSWVRSFKHTVQEKNLN